MTSNNGWWIAFFEETNVIMLHDRMETHSDLTYVNIVVAHNIDVRVSIIDFVVSRISAGVSSGLQ